jgi:hypothetical protein
MRLRSPCRPLLGTPHAGGVLDVLWVGLSRLVPRTEIHEVAAYHDGGPIFPLKGGVNPCARKGTKWRGVLAQSTKSKRLLWASQASFSHPLQRDLTSRPRVLQCFLERIGIAVMLYILEFYFN